MDLKTFLRANWDRATAVALVVLGMIVLLLGWIGMSGTGLVAEQNPYLISGGVLGIAFIGIGCTVWLSADLQDEWRRLDEVEAKLAQLVSASVDPTAESTEDVQTTTDGEDEIPVAKPRRRRTPVKAAR